MKLSIKSGLLIITSCLMSIILYSQSSITIKGSSLTIQKGITVTELGSIDIADNGTQKGSLNNSGIISLKGNINNNTKNENLGDGEFQINGSYSQFIKGNNSLGNLTINKSYKDLTLNGNLTVTGQIKFIKGLINTTNDYILVLEPSGTIYGASATDCGANDLSYVNGPMIKNGNSKFIFPVGKNTSNYPLHPIILEVSGNSNGSYKAEYINNAIEHPEQKPNNLKYISQSEYWLLNQLNGTNTGYVTLGLRNVTSNLKDVVVMNYNEVTNTGWQNAGNTGLNFSNSNDAYLRSGVINQFTKFTYGSTSSSPYKLIDDPLQPSHDIKIYPNPNEGKDINLDINKK